MKKLSVIIPTRNRAKLLETTLHSIVNQSLAIDDFEVIVVDNGSTDETADIAKGFSQKLQLVLVYDATPGLHVGRHKGMSAASTDILVFIDDDIEAHPKWLETIYETFQGNPKIGLIGGKNLPKYQSPPPFWITEMWNRRIRLGHVMSDLSILDFGDVAREIPPDYVYGCNFSVRREVILSAGGFHPDGFPFELIKFRGDGETHISDFVAASAWVAFYHPGASVNHWVPTDRMTEEYFCKRRYMQGISAAFADLRARKSRSNVQATWMEKLKFKIKAVVGTAQIELLNEISKDILKTDFEKRLMRSYRLGREFLYSCYDADASVREWVHKKDYF